MLRKSDKKLTHSKFYACPSEAVGKLLTFSHKSGANKVQEIQKATGSRIWVAKKDDETEGEAGTRTILIAADTFSKVSASVSQHEELVSS